MSPPATEIPSEVPTNVPETEHIDMFELSIQFPISAPQFTLFTCNVISTFMRLTFEIVAVDVLAKIPMTLRVLLLMCKDEIE